MLLLKLKYALLTRIYKSDIIYIYGLQLSTTKYFDNQPINLVPPNLIKLAWLRQKVVVLGPLGGFVYGFVGSQRCRGGLFRDLAVRH